MRRPLPVLSAIEKLRRQAAAGLDSDNIRLDFTPAERLAARDPGLPASKERSMEPKPLVPAAWALIAGALSAAMVAVHSALPSPLSWIVFVLACIAAVLAGLGLPQPKFLEGKPVLPAALVPLVASAAPILYSVAEGLPEGLLRSACLILVVALCGAAGLAAPQPKVVPPPLLPR